MKGERAEKARWSEVGGLCSPHPPPTHTNFMRRVDLVLVGAEAVAESGGVVNKLGTYTVALAAKAHAVPLYVAAESYKFAR